MDRPDTVARFTPLRRVTSGRRMLLFTIGPLLWLGGIAAVAYVVHRGYAVGIALIVLAAALIVSLVILVPMRIQRARRDRER